MAAPAEGCAPGPGRMTDVPAGRYGTGLWLNVRWLPGATGNTLEDSGRPGVVKTWGVSPGDRARLGRRPASFLGGSGRVRA